MSDALFSNYFEDLFVYPTMCKQVTIKVKNRVNISITLFITIVVVAINAIIITIW